MVKAALAAAVGGRNKARYCMDGRDGPRADVGAVRGRIGNAQGESDAKRTLFLLLACIDHLGTTKNSIILLQYNYIPSVEK